MVTMYMKVDVKWGVGLQKAINDAKALAQKIGIGVEFDFNGNKIRVYENTDTKQLHDEIFDKM